MITMRLFAEEKRSGTIELLVTSPVTDMEIILGKWLGAMGMYAAILLASSCFCLSFVFMFGNPDWRPLATAYLGMFLQGGALLSIGMFISNTTKNQIVAGATTFGMCAAVLDLRLGDDIQEPTAGPRSSPTSRSRRTSTRSPAA